MKFLYSPKISPWSCVSENDNESAPDFLGDGIVIEQATALRIRPGSDGVLTVAQEHLTPISQVTGQIVQALGCSCPLFKPPPPKSVLP